jgi:glycosyltransferase involved in cell wall biosynthesis
MSPRIILSWARRGPPAFIGGAEQATWRLFERLATRGVETHVIGRSLWPWQSGDVSSQTARIYRWGALRCVEAASEEERLVATRKLCADGRRTFLLSALEGSAETFANCADIASVTAIHWVHSAGEVIGKAIFRGIELYASRYLADLGGASGDDILRPLVGHHRCSSGPSRALCTGLFVNPIPEKGFDTVVAVAEARSDLRFIVRLGWYDELLHVDLPSNITVQKRSEWDECIYSQVDFVLMPSQLPEGFGLVAAEALSHGIPCLGSRVGGLPEILPPEFIVDHEPLWCASLARLAENLPDAVRLAARAGADIRRREEISLEQFSARIGLS